jgi:dienelactone hydrolase
MEGSMSRSGLDKLQQEFCDRFGTSPARLSPEIEVLSKSVKQDVLLYEEWKIQYRVETADTMPTVAGQVVPAYVLIPRDSSYTAPFPGVVCFHQCNVDCLIGKDAVVGKAPGRRDQAYGYELVNQGFVVLAPDTLNCGERNIPSIRQKDEIRKCHAERDKLLAPYPYKFGHDARCAVDVLQSLGQVDSARIGAVGHSGGGYHVLDAMAHDRRIKAGVASCPGLFPFLPLISPRLLICFDGELQNRPSEREQQIKGAFEQAMHQYEEDGAAENIVYRTLSYAHAFPDEFKREAYMRLKGYFGLLPEHDSHLDLEEVIREALKRNAPFWHDSESGNLKVKGEGRPYLVRGNLEQLTTVFQGLIWALQSKRPSIAPFLTSISESLEGFEVMFGFPCADPEINDRSEATGDLFMLDQWLYEHSAIIRRAHRAGEFRLIVSLPRSNGQTNTPN